MARRLPLSIQSSDGKSKEFTVEKLINLYIEPGSPTSKSPALLLNRPMLSNWLNVGDGPIRGFIKMGGDLFLVSGLGVYIVVNMVATLLGNIRGTGPVSMAENGAQVGIAADDSGWVATATDLTEITSDAFVGATTFTYLDTFGIVTKPNSAKFQISTQLDFLSYNALDFATAESDPDDLVAAESNHRWLWLFGEKTIQVYYNSGDVDFPFAPLNDIVIERGLGARFSVAKEDNTIFFLGDDGIVYRFNGFTPVSITTPAIATRIAGFSKSSAVGQFMDNENQKFYILSFPEATLVYDLATGLWADWETDGDRWTGQMVIKAFGRTLVGDRLTGQIYFASPDVFQDSGADVISIVRFPPVQLNRERASINSIECDLDSGEGPDEGFVMMRVSADGRSWSQPRTVSYGKIGEFNKRAILRKFGQLDRQVHVEFAISSNTPRRISGGWIEIE